jgi:hypothetical protein
MVATPIARNENKPTMESCARGTEAEVRKRIQYPTSVTLDRCAVGAEMRKTMKLRPDAGDYDSKKRIQACGGVRRGPVTRLFCAGTFGRMASHCREDPFTFNLL